MAGALSDLRVIDLTQWLAGPLTTTLLGQLGAEVIKVERPGSGDPARVNVLPRVKGWSYGFLFKNANKKGITLDLKKETGKEIFKRLAEKGDVVINNFTPGVMERLGLGYEELKRVNPRLIYASTSGFGQTGPYSYRKCYDPVAQAMGGVMSVTGQLGDPPTKTGPAVADIIPPILQAVAILAAVHYREKTGRGQALDIAQLDAMCLLTSIEFWSWFFVEGKVIGRLGNKDVATVPSNCYRARDGYLHLCVTTDAEWKRLVEVMGRPELVNDHLMATVESRFHHGAEVDAIIQEWMGTQRVAEAEERLVAAGLVCGPVLTMDQVINHPQVLARNMVVEQDHPVMGRVKVCGSVFKASETPGEIRSPAPLLGQHNEEVYCSLLGYTKEDLERWKREKII